MKRRELIALLTGVAVFWPRAALAQPSKSQPILLGTYEKAVADFRSILKVRRTQADARQLPNLPAQALYLARNAMISAYKDLTDAVPTRIGRRNKFELPPAYFDADNEPLFDEYYALIGIMETPPAGAQFSETPFDDVIDLAAAIARVKGLDNANAEVAARISLGIFFAETSG